MPYSIDAAAQIYPCQTSCNAANGKPEYRTFVIKQGTVYQADYDDVPIKQSFLKIYPIAEFYATNTGSEPTQISAMMEVDGFNQLVLFQFNEYYLYDINTKTVKLLGQVNGIWELPPLYKAVSWYSAVKSFAVSKRTDFFCNVQISLLQHHRTHGPHTYVWRPWLIEFIKLGLV